MTATRTGIGCAAASPPAAVGAVLLDAVLLLGLDPPRQAAIPTTSAGVTSNARMRWERDRMSSSMEGVMRLGGVALRYSSSWSTTWRARAATSAES